MQSIVVLNMNTEVFRIHDMNTLYKIGGHVFYVSVEQVWLWAELVPDRLFSKYHVTALFKMQKKKLTMFYIKAHNPFVIKI